MSGRSRAPRAVPADAGKRTAAARRQRPRRRRARRLAIVFLVVVLALVVPALARGDASFPDSCSASFDPATCERVDYLAQRADADAQEQHEDTWIMIGVLAVVIAAPGLWRVLLV